MQANNEQRTTRNYRNSYPKSRFRPRAISYVKRFKTFEEGFSEIIKYNPELKNYCGRDPIVVDVIAAMLNSVKDNIPTTDNSNYPNTLSLSIDTKEVGFKTDINIAIGWRTEYFFKEGKTYYNFRISFFTIPSYKKSIIEEMIQSGWKKIESGEYRSHFWDKTSDKPNMRKKRRFHSDSQKISTVPKERQESVDLLPDSDDEIEKVSVSNHINNIRNMETEDIGAIPANNNPVEIAPEDTFEVKDEISIEEEVVEDTAKVVKEVPSDVKAQAQAFDNPKDSVVKSPVNGTYIVTHNNKTNVINMNDPENENNMGIIIDREKRTATYPDGAVFNLNF